ncbi:MAG: restriction endonuclease subunit S [Clostridiales bacterium]|nr:restriction endonuclease subunit S [Candidatus Crickella caballi]
MKLNEICEVYSGYALKSFNDVKDGLPVVKIGNIHTDGTLNLEECQYTSDVVSEKYYSQKDDIYIALSGATTGKIGKMDTAERYVINQRVGIVRKKSDNVPQEYIKYFLLRQTNRILQDAAGCAQPNISPKQIAEYIVPDTSEEKMVEICKILEKTKNIIDSRKAELIALDELIKARFVEMFGDQRTNPFEITKGTLKDVADIYLGLTHTPEYVDSGKPFLSVRDISSGVIDFSNCHYITEDEFYSLPKGARPREHDLLFCRVGTIGKPVIIPEGTPEFGTFVSVGFLRKKDNVLNTYLKAWMENDCFMEQVYQNVKGASQVNLNTGWLKEFEILMPSMEMQIEFDNFCKQVDKSKFINYIA